MKTIAQSIAVAALLFCGLAPLAPRVSAQGGVPLWTNTFRGVLKGSASPTSLAVGVGGNVFVTARMPSSMSALVAYSNEGVPLWTNYCANAQINAAAADTNGTVVVTGDSTTIKYSNTGMPLWTNNLPGIAVGVDKTGIVSVRGLLDSGWVTIAYSASGIPLWTNRFDYDHNPVGAIALDGDGKVFVTGSVNNGLNTDYATIAYSKTGVPLWTNRYDGSYNNNDFAQAIAVDRNGNVFVTGSSRIDSVGGSAADDYATVAYSNSGALLWVRRYNGPADQGDSPSAIAVDGGGNVFVTGSSVTTRDFVLDPPDYATIKYSNSGVPLWTNRYNGPENNSDTASSIVADRAGNVFVTGISAASPSPPASFATVGYSDAGIPLWTNRYNRENLVSWPFAIAADHFGNVFVAGYAWGLDGYAYYTTIKYSSSVPPARLSFHKLNQLVLSWTNAGFTLQSAPGVTGPFTNVPAATSPYTNPLTAPQEFFRLIQN